MKKDNNTKLNNIIQQALDEKRSNLKPVGLDELNNRMMQPKTKMVANIRTQTKTNIKQARVEARKNHSVLGEMTAFMGNSGNYYITFGGVGDLVLLLAEAYKDPNAKMIFYANEGSLNFAKIFLNEFKIPHFIKPNIMGSSLANMAVEMLRQTNRLMTSAHLPDDLDYGDWSRNLQKYIPRLTRITDWKQRFGFIPDLKQKKVVILAPSGSYRNNYKQKYITTTEYNVVVDIYLKNGYIVYATGSEADKQYYGQLRSMNHFWLTSEKVYNHRSGYEPINLRHFLALINSATEVVSVDTWLKTYSALADIPTKIFENRYGGKIYDFGRDSGDLIFLNDKIWKSMSRYRIEDFISNNAYL